MKTRIMTALSDPAKPGEVPLADIARRAGVSPITASRALRGSNLVAQATRERILAAATDLGFDDIPYAASTQVPLTIVAIPMRRMGELAAEILFDRSDGVGPSAPRQVLLPPELMVRGSSP